MSDLVHSEGTGLRWHKQRFRHDPENGVYGDCYRTVLACLFGLEPEQVPHFMRDSNGVRGYDEAREWLAARGYSEVTVPVFGDIENLPQILENMRAFNDDGTFYLLSGISRTGCGHVVVCQYDEIVHDPSLTDAGIVAPFEDGTFRISFIAALRGAPACARIP